MDMASLGLFLMLMSVEYEMIWVANDCVNNSSRHINTQAFSWPSQKDGTYCAA